MIFRFYDFFVDTTTWTVKQSNSIYQRKMNEECSIFLTSKAMYDISCSKNVYDVSKFTNWNFLCKLMIQKYYIFLDAYSIVCCKATWCRNSFSQ